MGKLISSALPRRAAAVGTIVLLSAGAIAATAGTASAASILHAKYKVSGSTFLAGPSSTLNLGPGSLSARLNTNTGKLTATLALPPATGSFTEFGIIPVTATAKFINDGPTTGKVKNGTVSTTSTITLQLTNLSIAGIPVPVGNSCETAQPVVVSLQSQKGFSVLDGGTMAGTYTIGDFAHCGLATSVINLTIPASGNTITFTLGKAKIIK